jgi:hypothetical protein
MNSTRVAPTPTFVSRPGVSPTSDDLGCTCRLTIRPIGRIPTEASRDPGRAGIRQERRMAWTYLLLAGLLEVVWAFSMKQSQGFTLLVPSVVTAVAMAASVVLLALAMRSLRSGPSSSA